MENHMKAIALGCVSLETKGSATNPTVPDSGQNPNAIGYCDFTNDPDLPVYPNNTGTQRCSTISDSVSGVKGVFVPF